MRKLRLFLMIHSQSQSPTRTIPFYEERFLDIGLSMKCHVLVVWYTERGENIRIIGSCKATRMELEVYEERKTKEWWC